MRRASAEVGGVPFDMFEESQMPHDALVSRCRREKRDQVAARTGKGTRFTKLDFIDLVLSKARNETFQANQSRPWTTAVP